MMATMTHQMAVERSLARSRDLAANAGCRDVGGEPSPQFLSSSNPVAIGEGMGLAIPAAVSFTAPPGH
jgi:hypothetical protein